ncbi:MAG: acetyl-CoA C-acyltransferase, partial [Gammaproteobacteria bacterium]|nr:acetyl-CoA C-acyltransferase [Gammaproteobacteria bacterium]
MSKNDIVIVGSARTPMGSFQGNFATVPAANLGGVAISAALSRSGLSGEVVCEVLMGNCLLAGQGQAPARQAAFLGGLPASAGAVTLSKMCGSGMRAIMFGYDMLVAGSAEVIVAGGMENMSRAPYLVNRNGFRLGHDTIYDHLMLDGLEDAYERGRSMGTFGEDCAKKYQFTRQEQDEFASASVTRAKNAIAHGLFKKEIVPVEYSVKGKSIVSDTDEGPGKIDVNKIPLLKPAFDKNGTITAASSSSINDGAAAVVIMRRSKAEELGCKPIAKIVGHSVFAQQPNWFTTAPVGATQKLLSKINWQVADVDLWEVNEAFAVVPMAFMRELNVTHAQLNIHGGACALGHPIGASGARIV